MKQKRQVQKLGVKKWSGEDLLTLQAEPLRVLDGFFAQFGSLILSGCEVVGNDIAPGIVGLYGQDADGNPAYMAVPFDGRTGSDVFPVYLTLAHTTETREYGDNEVKPVAYDYFAQATTALPQGINFIAITATGGKRFTDILLSETQLAKLAKLGGIEEFGEGQTVESRVKGVEKYIPTYLDYEPDKDDDDYLVGAQVWTRNAASGARTFWRCYDNAEGAAVWAPADGGGTSMQMEKANIRLTSNQEGVTLTGTKFNILADGEPSREYTFNGTVVTAFVTPGKNYQIVPRQVAGYKTPATQIYTSVLGNARDVQLSYLAEKLSIGVSTDDVVSVSGQTVTVTNTAGNGVIYTGAAGAAVNVLIPQGITYKIALSAMTGYAKPSDVIFTSSLVTRGVSLQYVKILINEITFNKNVADPANIDRGANQDVINTILSKIRCCLVKKVSDGKTAIRYLKNNTRNYYDDGVTPTILTGGEGDVMVYLPEFYYKFTNTDANQRKLAFSLLQIDGTWKKVTAGLIGAYKSFLTDGKLYSRSGVVPTVNTSQTAFIAAAVARGAGYGIIDYEMHCAIAFLFYAKYGTRNSQAILGAGGALYNSNNVTGQTDNLGNADTQNNTTTYINFQGIEGVHNGLTEWLDGVVVNNRVWTIKNLDGTQRTVQAGTTDGWITDLAAMGASDFMDIVPLAVGGSETTHFADYYYQNANNGLALLRSNSSSGTHGGVSYTDANNAPSITYAYVGSRLAFRGVIEEAASVLAFRSLPVL
ncbi:hypothetical protein EZS27_014994 [termite gut metagenome]|uniref:Uncharacterized protein n=1 Tax=termite gut metagenome TaxID=433724 RepID=A0A5J4RV79_9ZZZZ